MTAAKKKRKASRKARGGVSVILPVYNGAVQLRKCLRSLKEQTYPFRRLDLIVVDDASNDDTVAVAKSFGARIIKNGARHIERGKALGLRAARHDRVLFVDADNYLPDADWLENALQALESDKSIVGVQSARFHYRREDPAANRYCSLMGVNDPMAYYLGKRDRLTAWEKDWTLLGRVEREEARWWVVRFAPDAVPTLGSQVFLTRRSLLKKATHWPLYFHMDANVELIRAGHDRYALLKQAVGHDHCADVAGFTKKCRRNLDLFFRYRHLRHFTWETPRLKFLWTVFSMVTGIRPLLAALRGFAAVPDAAWFIHVWVSMVLPIHYAWQTLFARPEPVREDFLVGR